MDLEKAIQEAQKAVAIVQERYSDKNVRGCLFGSQVDGTARPDSDVDLLLLIEEVPLQGLNGIAIEVERDYREAGGNCDLHVTAVLKSEWDDVNHAPNTFWREFLHNVQSNLVEL